MELFDLVDINDNVIGTTDKVTAHSNGDIHRCIAVYVFNQKSELYVQEHLKSGCLYDHSIGGHVSKGENYDDAATREAEEELNITFPLKKISTFYSDETNLDKPMRHMFGLYECYPPASWEFSPNEEVNNIIPMTIQTIVELMNREPQRFTGGFINTMAEYIKYKKLPYTIIKSS